MSKPTHVTQPSLPELNKLIPFLEKIWETRVLSNCGPFHEQLEKELAIFLGVPYLSLFNNATTALITALNSLELTGEVITTPFTFLATANAIAWNRLVPRFVDIDRSTLNIDPAKISEAINPSTSAILPVHVFGNPCDADAIEQLAEKHGLKVIYDAAHAFGVDCDCGSILKHGDLSVLSFHATKIFNTFEGGAVISHTEDSKARINQLRNFGFTSDTEARSLGLNGKMNEFSAAIGLAQLEDYNSNLRKRANIDKLYRKRLQVIDGIKCFSPLAKRLNYSYVPILVTDEFPRSRDDLLHMLKDQQIFARRYFFPLVCDLEPFKYCARETDLSNSRHVAERILCLPIHSNLELSEASRICDIIESAS